MSLFSKLNKNSAFAEVNTKDFTFVSPKDMYLEVGSEPFTINGVYLDKKSSKFGTQAVAILSEYNKLLNLPSYLVEDVQTILESQDMIDEIKASKVKISLTQYTNDYSKQKDGSIKHFYSVTWVD